jgi:hypothetical protein
MYGLPGLKLGLHHHLKEVVNPDTMDRTARARDEAILRGCAARYFPDGAGETLALKTCLYTNTPDGHFIVDHHPDYPQVVIGGGFSGHGFKFCSVVGEILPISRSQGQHATTSAASGWRGSTKHFASQLRIRGVSSWVETSLQQLRPPIVCSMRRNSAKFTTQPWRCSRRSVCA